MTKGWIMHLKAGIYILLQETIVIELLQVISRVKSATRLSLNCNSIKMNYLVRPELCRRLDRRGGGDQREGRLMY